MRAYYEENWFKLVGEERVEVREAIFEKNEMQEEFQKRSKI